MITEIASALLGAIAAGGFQTIATLRQQKRDRQAALVAVVSEVDAICRLIRHQHYLEAVEDMLALNEAGQWDGRTLVVDIRSDYFTVFNGLAPRLGELEPEHVRDIVRFYAYAKSAIDSFRPDGPHADPDRDSPEEILNNFENVRTLLGAMLVLGERIRGFPGEPIAGNFAPWPGEEPNPETAPVAAHPGD